MQSCAQNCKVSPRVEMGPLLAPSQWLGLPLATPSPLSLEEVEGILEETGVADDWQRVAEALAQRRAELALSQIDVARRAQLSVRTIAGLSQGQAREYTAKTLRLVEQALQWPPGTIRAYLEDRPPPQEPPAPLVQLRAETLDEAEQMIRQVVEGLAPHDVAARLKLLAEQIETAPRTARAAGQ